MAAVEGVYINKILVNVIDSWPVGLSRNGEYRILINKLKGTAYFCIINEIQDPKTKEITYKFINLPQHVWSRFVKGLKEMQKLFPLNGQCMPVIFFLPLTSFLLLVIFIRLFIFLNAL